MPGKILFAGLIFVTITACNTDTARIQFLLDNVSKYGESCDLEIFMNDSLVLSDTLKADGICDNYSATIIELQKGRYSFLAKSPSNGVEERMDFTLNSDTTILLEYVHSDKLSGTPPLDSLVEGKKEFFVITL